MSTYVLIFGRIHRLEEQEAFEAAFHEVSSTVVNSVKGIIRDELIHDGDDPYTYIMLSEWENKDAWAAWQKAPIHEEQVGGMKKYWKGQGVKICHTAFCVNRAGV